MITEQTSKEAKEQLMNILSKYQGSDNIEGVSVQVINNDQEASFLLQILFKK
jgi:hypothetical protein